MIFVLLVLMAGLRGPLVDRDYSNYLDWFSLIRADSVVFADFAKDPAFVAISVIVSSVHGTYALIATIFAILALSLKWTFGKFATEFRLLPIYVYLVFCRFFLAQEMTAIRAAVAIPIMSFGLLAAFRGHRIRAVVLIIIAITFHASTVLCIPLLLVAMGGKIESRRAFVYLATAAIVMYGLLSGILTYLATLKRLSDYLNGTSEPPKANLLSIYFIFHLPMVAFVVGFLWKKISSEEKFVVFCSSYGLALYLILASNATFALRSSEMFGIFDVLVFLIPAKILRGNTRVAYCAVLILFGALLFVSEIRIMNPYKTVLSDLDRPRFTSRRVV